MCGLTRFARPWRECGLACPIFIFSQIPESCDSFVQLDYQQQLSGQTFFPDGAPSIGAAIMMRLLETGSHFH